jgi:hypothetical protein
MFEGARLICVLPNGRAWGLPYPTAEKRRSCGATVVFQGAPGAVKDRNTRRAFGRLHVRIECERVCFARAPVVTA